MTEGKLHESSLLHYTIVTITLKEPEKIKSAQAVEQYIVPPRRVHSLQFVLAPYKVFTLQPNPLQDIFIGMTKYCKKNSSLSITNEFCALHIKCFFRW